MDSTLPDIEALITFLRTEEGGRSLPAFSGYRPQFYYEGEDWDAEHSYPGVEQVNPGDTVTARLTFTRPHLHVGRIHVGTEFLIREGAHTVGKGKVTRILHLEDNATRVRGFESNAASPLAPRPSSLTPPMEDNQTTVADLRQIVAEFVHQRDWRQFHTPKNLAMALAIEAAELMEHFQWLTAEQSRAVAHAPGKLAEVADELADVFCYGLAMANELGIDVAAAIEAKMVKNAEKYPASEYRGRYGADDPGQS